MCCYGVFINKLKSEIAQNWHQNSVPVNINDINICMYMDMYYHIIHHFHLKIMVVLLRSLLTKINKIYFFIIWYTNLIFVNIEHWHIWTFSYRIIHSLQIISVCYQWKCRMNLINCILFIYTYIIICRYII